MKKELLTMSDGVKINLAVWTPENTQTSEVKGAVQFIHGFGEHSGRYYELAERFTKKGFAFIFHDQRGHGETQGKRGVASSYGKFLDDAAAVRCLIKERFPSLPIALYGHSMGGNIALNLLLSDAYKNYACAVIGCPWLRLNKPFPSAVVTFAKLAGKISPNITVRNKLDLNVLSHDGEIVETARGDMEYHNHLSLKIFTEITERGEYAIKNADKLTLPTLMLCAGQDMLVSPQAIEEFCEKANDNVRLIKYPKLYHELHNEIERADIFGNVLDFITENI